MKYITIVEAAKILGKSRTRIYQLIAEKKIKMSETKFITKKVLAVSEEAIKRLKTPTGTK